jgi:hypothetical protein
VKFFYAAAALLSLGVCLPATSIAQTSPPAVGATAQLTAKIVAIDYDNRIVTLQDAQGNVSTIKAGADVTRFAALKVGDTVTFQYTESIAYAIAPAGTAPAPASTPMLTRASGDKPGGTISQTVSAQVTIQAIDAATPSITVKTPDGHVITMLVNNPGNLSGLKVGDVVQITYTQALMITVQ